VDDAVNLPLPDIDAVRRTAASFAAYTSSGSDHFHPRHLGLLSDGAVLAIIDIWRRMMSSCQVPGGADLLIVALIPKPLGGERPIGIFPSILRVLTRWLRRTLGRQWLAANARPQFYGRAGHTAEQCVWMQSALTANATASGHHAASVLLDVSKAFENVQHHSLVASAEKYGFNLKLLMFLLRVYRMPRCIRVGRAYTDVVSSSKTIVAGCAFADIMMMLALLPAIDNVAVTFPRLHLAVVVDDIQMLATGRSSGEVACQVRDAIALVAYYVEDVAKLTLSDPKTLVITNSKESARAVSSSVKRLKGSVVRSGRNLGVDFAAGKRSSGAVRKRRLLAVLQRIPRLKRLMKARASTVRIVRCGLLPAATYGVGVTGISDGDLRSLRVTARKGVVDNLAGRSLTVDLMLFGDRFDPAYVCNRAPIVMWLTALWNAWIPRSALLRSMVTAIRVVQDAERPWLLVDGPSAAVIATFKRIGWFAISPIVWRTHRGDVISIDLLCPRSVGVLVDDATSVSLWKTNTISDELCGGVCATPLVRLLRAPEGADWNREHKGHLRSIVAGGQWPQARLADVGYADDDGCLLCGQRCDMFHRFWGCAARDALRGQLGTTDYVVRRAIASPTSALWSRCLLPDPSQWAVKPSLHLVVNWALQDGSGTFSAIGFGDGSGTRGNCTSTRRAGWGVTSLANADPSSALGRWTSTASAYGPLPGLLQTVVAAETYALYVFLLNVGLPLADGRIYFYSDNAYVVDTFARGRRHATCAYHTYADLWRLVFNKVDDIGSDVVVVRKVKAHATLAEIGLTITHWERAGNYAADSLAKRGVRCHPDNDHDILRVDRCEAVIDHVARFVARLNVAAVGQPDSAKTVRSRVKAARARRCRGPTQRLSRHSIVRINGLFKCTRCVRTSSVSGRIDTHACWRSFARHNLWRLEHFWFCVKCGAFAYQRSVKLCTGCTGRPSSVGKARVLRLLRNGRDPYSGRTIGIPLPIVFQQPALYEVGAVILPRCRLRNKTS
jgi:hypothetical protein